MRMVFLLRCTQFLAAVALSTSLFIPGTSRAVDLESCLRQALVTADDSVTMGELREQCRQNIVLINDPPAVDASEQRPVEHRLEQEREIALQRFGIMSHRPNFFLPVVYNSKRYNAEYHRQTREEYRFDRFEAQFQISIKSPLVLALFSDTMDIYAGYTNHSFWQVFNDDISSPFRETNHEPELWVQFHPDWQIFGFRNTYNSLGINHQSNGQSGELSRSWNRFYGNIIFERGRLALKLTPWVRISEGETTDDNPDITEYLGDYELGATYKRGEHTISLMVRNHLESGFSKGAVQASWSFPFGSWPYLRGYVQYFNGYGESLIDYNQYVNRLGIGVSLSDWL
jgi:phospholipase A1/A2